MDYIKITMDPQIVSVRKVTRIDLAVMGALAAPRPTSPSGPVSYAAPEQPTGHDIDRRADQYALAGTAFRLLTGAPPYENSNPVAVISAHLTAPPPNQREAPRSRTLGRVLASALANTAAERFVRSKQFAAAFRQAVGSDSTSAQPTQGAIPPAPPAPQDRHRYRSNPSALRGAF